MDNLVEKGDKLFKKGKKELKTGLFKWKPDHDAALSYFEEAVQFFKNGKSWEKAITTYKEMVDCHKFHDDAYGIGKCLEGIVDIMVSHPETIKNDQELIDFARESGQYYKAEDAFTQLIKMYTRLGNYYESAGKPQQAEMIAKEAYESAIESEKKYNVSDIMNYYIEILVKNAKYDEAIKVYKEQIQILKIGQTQTPLEQHGLLIVCLCFIMNEPIRANNEFQEMMQEIPNFMKTTEYQSCNKMIYAYENGEQEEFTKTVSRPPVNLQYPVIIPRLVKKVQIKQMLVTNNLGGGMQQQQQQQSEEQQGQQMQSQDQQASKEQQQKQLEDMLF